jgi:sensor histidine kinase regulating citrate/malate metabolism
LLIVTVSLGYLLVSQTRESIITLMQTRMLDISNTAAAMIDGDALKDVSPADEGTDTYESIMRTLRYFQDNIDLKYIYCVRDMGDGTFTFGLDPTAEDPGEFGSPIVYTDALYEASKGHASADDKHYEDAWGTFYSAYSPVFDSKGKVAGIIAVDFSAEWYNQQLSTLTWTTIVVGVIALLVGGGIVTGVINQNKIDLDIVRNGIVAGIAAGVANSPFDIPPIQ